MRAFVYVFPLLFSIVAAIFDAKKMAASGPQRNRNVNKRMHCIVVDQGSLSWYKLKTQVKVYVVFKKKMVGSIQLYSFHCGIPKRTVNRNSPGGQTYRTSNTRPPIALAGTWYNGARGTACPNCWRINSWYSRTL